MVRETAEARDVRKEAEDREAMRLKADQLGNQVTESENAMALIRATGTPTPKQLADHAELVSRYQAARTKAERA